MDVGDVEYIVNQEIQRLLGSVKKTALADEKISRDEAELLDLISNYLDKMKTEITQILDMIDFNLSEDEIRRRVRTISRDIIPAVTDKAEEDGVITTEERAIINQIILSSFEPSDEEVEL